MTTTTRETFWLMVAGLWLLVAAGAMLWWFNGTRDAAESYFERAQQAETEWKEWCASEGGEVLDRTRIPPDETGDEFYYCIVSGRAIGAR